MDRENITRQELIELLREEMEKARPRREPGDATLNEIMAETGLPHSTLYLILKKKIQAGEIIKVTTVEDGHQITLYRVTKKNE